MLKRVRSRKTAIIALGIWLTGLVDLRLAVADAPPPFPTDTELFSAGGGLQPNVLFLLDTSSSMNECPNGKTPGTAGANCGPGVYNSATVYPVVGFVTPGLYQQNSGGDFTKLCDDVDAPSCTTLTPAQETSLKSNGQITVGTTTYIHGNFGNYLSGVVYDKAITYDLLGFVTTGLYRISSGNYTKLCDNIDAASCNVLSPANETQVKNNGTLKVGSTTYHHGNYANYLAGATKWGIARNVLRSLISSISGVKMALMVFRSKGGQLIVPFEATTGSLSTTDTLLTKILELSAPGGVGTPNAGLLQDGGKYYGGVYVKANQNESTGNAAAHIPCAGSPNCDSPIQSSCQKNYAILLTDGKPNSDLTNAEVTFPTGTPTPSPDPLVNQAGGLFNLDVRSSTPETEKVITYTIAFAISDPANDTTLLPRTATAGGGKSYTASNALELTTALTSILGEVLEQSFSFTAPVVPATSTAGEGKLYLASLKPKALGPFWEGFLKSYNMDDKGLIKKANGDYCTDASGNITCLVDGKVPDPDTLKVWDTGVRLQGTSAASRTIKTVIATGTPTAPTLVDFKSVLDSGGQVNYTHLSLTAAQGDTEAQKIINYFRGFDVYDTDGNPSTTERSSKGGDIFHSKPVIVGAPNLFKTDPTYSDKSTGFKKLKEDRKKIVVAGANHGVLHAFHAGNFDGRDPNTGAPKYINETGDELWAFVPNHLLPDLQNGTEKSPMPPHQYYVDGSTVAADICLKFNSDNSGNCDTAADWKTILITGSRMGSRGYFALDITNTAAPALLWSSDNANVTNGSFTDPNLGETWSDPAIGRLKVNGVPTYVAFFGGGMSDPRSPSVAVAADAATHVGKAFYVINLKTGAVIWSFTYNATTTDKKTSPQMKYDLPSKPAAVDTDNDGYVNHVYLGDLGGQMWRFDFTTGTSSTDTDNWSGARIFAPPATHPIYYPPSVTIDNSGRRWVFFGTGNRNYPNDKTSTDRFYAVIDGVASPIDPNTTPLGEGGSSGLLDLTTGLGTVTKGWFIQLTGLDNDGSGSNDSTAKHVGEKVLAASDVFGGVLFFTTYTPPTGSAPSNTCIAPAGSARLYAVHMETSAAAIDWDTGKLTTGDQTLRSRDVGSGVPSEPVIFDGKLVVGTTQEQLGGPGGTKGPGKLPDDLARPRIRYWRVM